MTAKGENFPTTLTLALSLKGEGSVTRQGGESPTLTLALSLKGEGSVVLRQGLVEGVQYLEVDGVEVSGQGVIFKFP